MKHLTYTKVKLKFAVVKAVNLYAVVSPSICPTVGSFYLLVLALSRIPKMPVHRASRPKEMSSAASSRESPAWVKRKEGTRIIAALMLRSKRGVEQAVLRLFAADGLDD